MSGTDLIHIGGGDYVVRDLYNAWRAAGSPPYNSAGRRVPRNVQVQLDRRTDDIRGGGGLMDPIEYAAYDVTCTTEGCENAGHTIAVYGSAESPQVVCGPCGQPITDIQPREEP